MSREKLKEIIDDFSPNKFRDFFRLKSRTFRPYLERLSQYDDEDFTQALFIGEIPFDNGQKLGIYSFRVNGELNERSGKKKQYEKGKKVLKDNQVDAGIFIFYDDNNNLRFSLIYTEYFGARRRFSYFKRFTFFVSPRLTNRTFLKQVGDGDFSSLEKIKEAFSVEPVTKEFYSELQSWYFWATDKVKFPEDYKYSNDIQKDRELRNATNLIRLITRIIFIWFLREKGLVTDELFDKVRLKSIVKDFLKDGSSNYYNAILQNLFFATLNQKIEERKFAIEGDFDANKKEYGVKNLYRYRDKFLISEEEVLELFKDIPFLNGGLFDCLDKEDDTGRVIYIDGFSRNPKKQAIISDYLFFQENEEGVDLSTYELGRNRPVRGLFEILKNYNFTVDESSSIDQEIALDPELLGKVFENLLACYTPETATTARKATGSYYTPREIVDYMVEESLFEYLSNRIVLVHHSNRSVLASEYFDPTSETHIYYGKYGKLPHILQENAWYFITFRLADSLPEEKIKLLNEERDEWLKRHGNRLNTLTEDKKKEYYRLFSERVEEWMDAGYGSCILRDEEVARIIADALLYYNNQRYILNEWVIMPNHVHMLIKPIGGHKLFDILHSLKSYTAHKINELTGRKGQVWMHESYDHIVRNERAFEAIKNYIKQNPQKAGISLPDYCCSWNVTEPSRFVNNRSEDASTTIDKIRLLLSYSDETPKLSDEEKKRIIKAIDEIKILDPACGSGAFPMGILHRMVYILQKLDPDNSYWRELQYEKALKATEEVFREPEKDKREEMLKDINEAFDENMNYPDYARKLYLIENCIYGVDIQPIAIQISKLRFFISLILDQKVDKSRDNFGIKPLPNLETKFVSANTLIGLEKLKQLSFGNDIIREEQEELKYVRHKYFNAKTRQEKLACQREDRRLRQEIAKKLKEIGYSEESAEKIANFDIFDQNASANWFDPEWMFGISVTEPSRFVNNRSEDASVTSGFDIVIGNPPYVRQEKIKELKPIFQKQRYKVFVSTADLYTYFYEKGYDLLCPKGILCFISSNKWMRAKYGEKLRKFLKENTKVLTLIDFGGYPVFEQTVDTNIILFQKVVESSQLRDQRSRGTLVTKFVNVGKIDGDVIEYIRNNYKAIPQEKLSDNAWTLADEKILALKEKIEKIGKPLKDWDVKIYFGIKTGFNEAFIIDTETRNRILANCKVAEPSRFGKAERSNASPTISRFGRLTELERTEAIIKPIIRGRDIGRYYYKWAGLWVIGTFPALRLNINDYPAIKKYFLDNFDIRQLDQSGKKYPQLGFNARKKTGNKWFETQDQIAYYPEFEKEKIVWNRITDKITFSYVTNNYYVLDSTFMITGEHLKYLIALLNSNVIAYWIKLTAATLGEGSYGAKIYIENSPIPPITSQNQYLAHQIESLVSQILSLTQSDDYLENSKKQAEVKEFENQINQLVYKLYGLTEEEAKMLNII
jgi:REP element-mobilizing transposase RayT